MTILPRGIARHLREVFLTEASRIEGHRERPGGEESGAARELSEQRTRIVHVLLGSIVALGMLAYVPSVWLAVQVGAWVIAVADTVVYAALVAAFLLPRIGYTARAGVLLGASYLLGALLIALLGPVSAGPLWLCAVPVLAAALFERRVMLWSLALTAVTLLATGVLLAAGWLDWGPWPAPLALFAVIGGNLLLLAGGLAFAVSTLIRGLRESAERTERLTAELVRERALLEASHRRLTRETAERADAEARLRQSEKLTALGTLAGGIAHNLNNLLTPLLMGVGLLRAEQEERTGTGGDDLLDQMEGAAAGARAVVRPVLTFARALPESRGAADAATAFREATRLLGASLPRSIELVTELDPAAGTIALSAADAHQILLNLGSNAMHAMPDGGRIEVSLGPCPPPPGADNSREYICLTVRDHGTGMDEETRRRAVEPFFTTKPPGRGTGLGLATVHGMVKAAGGTLRIESEPGVHTTVRVYLPTISEEAALEAAISEAIRSAPSPIIRDARPEEHSAVRALTLAAYEQYSRIMTPRSWAGLEEAVHAALATDEAVEWIVAELDGEIAGSVMLWPPATDAYRGSTAPASWPELRLLAVSPKARGRGIGQALVEECVRRARAAGATHLGLHTAGSMEAAVRMYERMGFVRAPQHDFQPEGSELVRGYALEL